MTIWRELAERKLPKCQANKVLSAFVRQLISDQASWADLAFGLSRFKAELHFLLIGPFRIVRLNMRVHLQQVVEPAFTRQFTPDGDDSLCDGSAVVVPSCDLHWNINYRSEEHTSNSSHL